LGSRTGCFIIFPAFKGFASGDFIGVYQRLLVQSPPLTAFKELFLASVLAGRPLVGIRYV
jgi:hypothetical protein